MNLKEIKKVEKTINDWWANKLTEQWDCDHEEIHQGIMYDFADYILSYEDIKLCVENKITLDKFLEWYDKVLSTEETQNLSNFIKYGWIE